jgi:hypothetical protein
LAMKEKLGEDKTRSVLAVNLWVVERKSTGRAAMCTKWLR